MKLLDSGVMFDGGTGRPKKKRCPRCKGKGRAMSPAFKGGPVRCWFCDGTGKVDLDYVITGPWT